MMGSIGTSAGPIQEEVELMVDVESRVTYLAEAHAVAEGVECRASGPEPGGATVNWAGGVWAGGKPGRWAGCRAWLAKSKWESLLAGAGGGPGVSRVGEPDRWAWLADGAGRPEPGGVAAN